MPHAPGGPKVSIIVVSWNGARLLKDCLESLCQQTYRTLEILAVDNGSTDASVHQVREMFPAVHIVELAENKGFAEGNVAGLKHCTGEFIALLNNDARADPRWLEELLHPMLDDPTIGVCASKLIIDGTGRINSAGDGLTTAGVGFNRGLWKERICYTTPELVFGGCGAAVLYRRKMLDEIGFLDEDFFLYDEDVDLNFRAQLAGWRCMYVPSAVVYHRGHATAGRLSDLHVYYHTRNLEWVWIKNMPGGLMWRFAHHKLLQEIGAFCYLCLRHRKWRPFVRAKRDALKMMPRMLAKRREVQRHNKVSNREMQRLLTPLLGKELLRQKLLQLIRG